MSVRKVPELSLLSYVNGTNADQVKFVDNIFSGLKDYGFIILKDHTIDQKKIEQAQMKVLKTKTVNQAFTETETSLIQLLLKAYSTKKNVEISAINHVLGIKDKNIGLQKKVRSDVINAINDKYVFISQGEINLIGSVRKEDDKRFFEYFVVPTEVKLIQKIIGKDSR